MRLCLFMTYGNSLQTWLSHGILDRELAIYHEHIKLGNQVTIFSYGNELDAEIIKKYDGIRILYNKWKLHPRIYANLSPLLFYNEFKNTSLFKTNQLAGSHIAIRVKRIVNRPLIVRQGYSHYEHRKLEYGSKSAEARQALDYERYCYSNADALFFTTREMLDCALKRQKMTVDDSFVMPNYVVEQHWAPKFSQPNTNQKNRLLFFGRLTTQKNLENLIAAMHGTRSNLLIVGDGPNEEILREASKKTNGRVEFLPRLNQEELISVMRTCNSFILVSLYEGHPKSLIEAMYFGMPCIISSAVADTLGIKNKKEALVCDTSVESITKAIKAFEKTSVSRLAEIARQGALKVSKSFSLASIVKKENQIMANLCKIYGE